MRYTSDLQDASADYTSAQISMFYRKKITIYRLTEAVRRGIRTQWNMQHKK